MTRRCRLGDVEIKKASGGVVVIGWYTWRRCGFGLGGVGLRCERGECAGENLVQLRWVGGRVGGRPADSRALAADMGGVCRMRTTEAGQTTKEWAKCSGMEECGVLLCGCANRALRESDRTCRVLGCECGHAG
eukprot:4144161-Pyramimonas_sp.AAC.1